MSQVIFSINDEEKLNSKYFKPHKLLMLLFCVKREVIAKTKVHLPVKGENFLVKFSIK